MIDMRDWSEDSLLRAASAEMAARGDNFSIVIDGAPSVMALISLIQLALLRPSTGTGPIGEFARAVVESLIRRFTEGGCPALAEMVRRGQPGQILTPQSHTQSQEATP